MSFFKSIAAPIVAVGAICGVIAVTAGDANAGAAGNAYAQQECDRRVRNGSIRFQSQYDQCLRSQSAFGSAIFGGSPGADAFFEEFNDAFGGGLF